ncbi:cell division protein ZipA [Paraglaciecola sp. L3A3]|uniref:cell division protein ZipA n=1 Tax=Paraglaciecola sp. L3A3 TaxID=2686358 RepID=UPI0018EEDCEE|nr:cell division protein ZipA [Paraglaciecola sp. L3A3]
MEDVLRWSLLVLGSCIIVGVLVHGIWVSRKNSLEKSANKNPDRNTEQELQPHGWHSEDKFDDALLKDVPNIEMDGAEEEPNLGFSADSDEPIVAPEQFDDLGIGAVRVVSSANPSTEPTLEKETTTDEVAESDKIKVPSAEPEVKQPAPSSKIYASVVTQPKPEFAAKSQSLAAETLAISKEEKESSAARQSDSFNISQVSNSDLNLTKSTTVGPDNYQVPEPPPFLLKQENKELQSQQAVVAEMPKIPPKQTASVVTQKEQKQLEPIYKESLTDQALNLVKRKKADPNRKRREPRMAEDQMRIDFDDEPRVKEDVNKPKATKTSAPQQEVLVLNVKVTDDSTISGAALLPMLLTLGFKFGEQDIFHRHVNSNGKGPVLFSLANMFKPGNFDIDNLENFTTQGVSLFMILPIEGDPHQVFNMMHNAARKISDEFSAQIYDGRRSLLTKQSLQQYVEKIREFERQRMLQR